MAAGRQQGTDSRAGQTGLSTGPPDRGIPAQSSYQPSADGGQLAAPEHNGIAHRLARGPFAGFIPWILFWVIGGRPRSGIRRSKAA